MFSEPPQQTFAQTAEVPQIIQPQKRPTAVCPMSTQPSTNITNPSAMKPKPLAKRETASKRFLPS